MHPPTDLDQLARKPQTMQVLPGKVSGAGTIVRREVTAPVKVSGYLEGVPEEGHTRVWYRDTPYRLGKLEDGRVSHYDRAESAHRFLHFTDVGTIQIDRVRQCPPEVEITMSDGLHRQVAEGKYEAFLDSGRIVLVRKEDISGGRLLVRDPALQEVQRSVEVVTRGEPRLARGRVSLDVSITHLGRHGQRYTNGFVTHLIKQLAQKDFPIAVNFATDPPKAIRAFGVTMFGTQALDVTGRLEVEVEAPSEILSMIKTGKAILEPKATLNILQKHGATEDTPPTAVCYPVLYGFALVNGENGSSLDLKAATLILDVPG